MNEKEKSLQAVLDQAVDGKKIFGTSFAVNHKGQIWGGASGDFKLDQPFFIVSTTKLFTTAILLQLRADGKLTLDYKVNTYLVSSILSGLHSYKEKDYSRELTLKQLLAHTSGLLDYFQNKGPDGKSLED